MIIHTFEDTGGDFLLQNSKIPKLTPELILRHSELYQQIQKLYDNVRSYEEKGWDTDDIVLRLGAPEKSLFSTVMAMREKYSDDYE